MTEVLAANPEFLSCSLHLWVPDDDTAGQPWRGFSAEIAAAFDDAPQHRQVGHLRGLLTFSPAEELFYPADAMSEELATLAAAAEQVLWDEMELVDTVMLLEMAVLESSFRGQGLTWKCITEVLRTVDSRTALVVLQPEPQREDGGPIEDEQVRGQALARLRAAWADYGFRPSKDDVTMWRLYQREVASNVH